MLKRVIANLGPDPTSTWNSIVNGLKLGTLVSLVIYAVFIIVYIAH